MTKSVFTDRYERLLTVLVQVRKDAGATQSQLAERLGKPQSYVSKIENGERRIDVIEFIETCEALGRHPSDVISRI